MLSQGELTTTACIDLHCARSSQVVHNISLSIFTSKATFNGVFYFIVLRMPYKKIETVNETTTKIHDLILEFNNTKFYVIPLVVYGMK
jgi:hypothetical protein